MRATIKKILLPTLTTALFICIGAAAVLWARHTRPARALEFQVYDAWRQRQRTQAAASACVLVTITDDDIREWGQYPISDRVMSDLLEKILAGEPSAIGLDIFRDQAVPDLKTGSNDQSRLAKIFTDNPQIVAPIAINDEIEMSVGPPPGLKDSPAQVAFVDLPPDEDDVVRRALLQRPDHSGEMRYSLASRVAQIHVGEKFDVSVNANDPWQQFGEVRYRPIVNAGAYGRLGRDAVQLLIDFRAPDFEPHSVQDVLAGRVEPGVFRDKVVLIGLWSRSVKDYINTPMRNGSERERDYGVTCHARIADQLIRAANGQPVTTRIWSARNETTLIVAFCVLGGALGFAARPPWKVFGGTSAILVVASVATLVLAILYFGARKAFDRGLWIPVVPPVAGFVACAAMVGVYNGVRGRQERNAMMQLISGFVSDDVAKLIWGDRDEVFTSGGLRPRRQRATMLFTDLKGFSSIAENMDASDLMRWLNEYFQGVSDLVKESGGLIMKFNGDQIVAVFGPPRNRSKSQAIEDARNAVRCALAMRSRLRELNDDWLKRGKPQALMRIGIHTGVLVAGSIGSRKRQEWTVVGHTVNIAARLESVKKDLMPPDIAAEGCRILISDKTAKHLDLSIDTRRVGRMSLKGIQRRMTVHGVIGWAVGAPVRTKTMMSRNPIEVRKQT